jgi:hypothetical protein
MTGLKTLIVAGLLAASVSTAFAQRPPFAQSSDRGSTAAITTPYDNMNRSE